MNNLKFKYAGAWNFMCFGSDGIELHLEKMGNILVVKGENWHDVNSAGKPGSNGSGKSSIQDIFSYGLYGRITREKINLGDLIHKESKKKMKVEVIWDDYRVVRTRKPDSLRLWKSENSIWDDSTEITCGAGVNETQKKIEAILGMNFKSFVGVTVFDDRNDHSFMEMDAPTKRIVVENLLSLEKYRDYGKVAKATRTEADKVIKTLSLDYERSVSEVEYAKRKVNQVNDQRTTWRQTQKDRIDSLYAEIGRQKNLLQNSDQGKALDLYNSAQSKIDELDQSIENFNKSISLVSAMLEEEKVKGDEIRQQISFSVTEKSNIYNNIINLEIEIENLTHKIKSLKKLETGVNCDKCYGIIDTTNADRVIEKIQEDISDKESKLNEVNLLHKSKMQGLNQLSDKIDGHQNKLRMISSKEQEIQQKINQNRIEINRLRKINKPELNKDTALIEQRIDDLHRQIDTRQKELNGPSPYDQIILDSNDEVLGKMKKVAEKKESIVKAEKMLPYYKFWVEAFGDTGIRKFVIDGIIPALNTQIAYWLDLLIYGNMKLSFDNMLEPTIERVPFDNDPFVYSIMSGGERRRMNLAVMYAFAHIQMLNCGSQPSILAIDEAVNSIDEPGREAFFSMVQELSNNRQVFLTTHDKDFLDLLQGCQVLKLERRDGITKLVA